MPSETRGMSRTRRYLPSEAMAWARSRGDKKQGRPIKRARRMSASDDEIRDAAKPEPHDAPVLASLVREGRATKGDAATCRALALPY